MLPIHTPPAISNRLSTVIMLRYGNVCRNFELKNLGEGQYHVLGERHGVADGTVGQSFGNSLYPINSDRPADLVWPQCAMQVLGVGAPI